jgi:hypothetical protein
MPVTDPEEYQQFIALGALDDRLKQPLIVSQEDPTSGSIYRYCSDDGMCGHSDEAGCRRSETIIRWEAENDRVLPADLHWGIRDQFFFFEDKIYYYKPFLEKTLLEDRQNREDALRDNEFLNLLNTVRNFIPNYEEETPVDSIEKIRLLAAAAPDGMPLFVEETDNFMVFESPGENLVTEITRSVLDVVKNSFNGQYIYPPFENTDALYINESKAYWADITKWMKCNCSLTKKGISFRGKFYPFDPLEEPALTLINLTGNFFSRDHNTEFEIISL